VVSLTPRPFYPWGNSPRYPLDRKQGEPQSRSGKQGEEKILDLTRTRTTIREPIVYKMWEPRRLTTPLISTARYRGSFTFFSMIPCYCKLYWIRHFLINVGELDAFQKDNCDPSATAPATLNAHSFPREHHVCTVSRGT
jgi:hypothetical protein